MPALHHPLPSRTATILRRAVLQLRTDAPRRPAGPVLHVGRPDGRSARYAEEPDGSLDPALRADIVAALLGEEAAGDDEPLVWLTRPGDLSLEDVDAAWLAAARQAFAEAGCPLTMVVVTRQGWRDPRSGTQQVWKRLRR